MYQPPNQLLVRPSPLAGESLAGYLLRVAEENGYRSGNWMLKQWLNVYRDRLFDPKNLAVLSHFTGQSERTLCDLAYLLDESRDGRYFHYFGHSFYFRCMKTQDPALCPLCLAETPATHGFWELNQVAVCPLHGIRLIDQCRQCGKLVKWDRRRVCYCNCGFDYRNAGCDPSDPAPLEVIRALYHVANISLLEYAPHSEFGLPLDLLQKETPSSLIWMISTLGRYTNWGVDSNGEGADYSRRLQSEYENLNQIANTLSYWPASLMELMYDFYCEAEDGTRYIRWNDVRYLHPMYKVMLGRQMPGFIQEIGKGFFEMVRNHEESQLFDWEVFRDKANPMIEASTCFS